MGAIDTDVLSEKYRQVAVRLSTRELLVSQIQGSEQESDLSESTNCSGLGRVRHFRRATVPGWVENPLPIDPAVQALRLQEHDELRAQVFQNAVCNWRCWYCFVPFSLLRGDLRHSSWRSATELVDLYAALPDRPIVLDLSGGQPDLVPEWVLWTMDALEERGLESEVYLWSDDNLSNDYFWRFLDTRQQTRVGEYKMYGRVCCFKGIDSDAFAFNTAARPDLFDRQFELFARLLNLGLDLYAYITLTTPNTDGLDGVVSAFFDRLQRIHENLPLRTIPLEVQTFSPVEGRLTAKRSVAMRNQYVAMEHWKKEIAARFTSEERGRRISEISLG